MWKFDKINTKKMYSLPAGSYYIGDICYVLNDDVYDTVFGGTGYAAGLYTSTLGTFLVSYTAGGDGSFTGTDGFDYCVDAGIIGIVSAGLLHKEACFGKVYEFSKEVNILMRKGLFTFQSGDFTLDIDTQG